MFQIRERDSTIALQRQARSMAEFTANGENIPTTENWSERWCTMPADFGNFFKQIYDFEVQVDDVFVVTFPKCGTTWLQEAAWLLINNLDFGAAKQLDLSDRSVFLDLTGIYNTLLRNTIELASKLPSPRLIKSHLPAHLLPRQIWQRQTKLLYCARNPKDVIVSYYHFHKGLGTWKGNLNEFVGDFLNNDIMYTPFWPSVMDFWQMRDENYIFFTTYEEMKHDLAGMLRRLNKFLARPELSDFELCQLVEHLSFENMKENKRTNPTSSIKDGHGSPFVLPEFEFMRRGVVGAYKDELSADNQLRVEAWTKKSLRSYNVTTQQIFGDI